MFDLQFLHASPFYELTALLTLAAVVGCIGLLLRQPMIVSFIAVGVLSGPSGFNIVKSLENIELLAELGVAVLLFLVGLKLDLKLVRTLGLVAVTTGLGQVIFTSLLGFFIGLALGLDTISSIYVAIALTFSSTIIIVKLLSDKRETDSLHGRIAIGFLIVQDLVVVLAMMVLSAFGIGEQSGLENSPVMQVVTVLFYGAIMLALVALFIRLAATPLARFVAQSPELLITFSIAWAALLAALGSYFGFSMELGGLLAGVSLASTPFREAIVARLSSLRDFLLLFFFIALGSQMDLNLLGEQILPAFVFSLFILIGNPLIVMIIMGVMGYRKRTSFLAGLTVAQISEFSLIFIAMGVSIGHLTSETLGLVTLVGLITIALSVYMITYSQALYRRLEPLLGFFERKIPHREESIDCIADSKQNYDVILFGLGRYGSAIAERLKKKNFKILAIDFNPEEVQHWSKLGYDAMYGDVCDQSFIEDLPLTGVKWAISALSQHHHGLAHEDPRLVLINGLKSQNFQGKIVMNTHYQDEVNDMKLKGADIVLLPFQDAADRAVEMIEEFK